MKRRLTVTMDITTSILNLDQMNTQVRGVLEGELYDCVVRNIVNEPLDTDGDNTTEQRQSSDHDRSTYRQT